MMRFVQVTGIAVAMLAAMLFAAPAYAQATRTWISGVGDDANPCSRTAPCKTFAGAISKTATGGEIDCLDPGGFGGVTITKSITLDCGGGIGGQAGSILVSGSNGISINCSGGSDPNCLVKVRNMTINGIQKNGSPGLSGIKFFSGAGLILGRDEKGRAVSIPFDGENGGGHTLIVGATGSGKTVTQTWIAVRAIERGMAAIMYSSPFPGLMSPKVQSTRRPASPSRDLSVSSRSGGTSGTPWGITFARSPSTW